MKTDAEKVLDAHTAISNMQHELLKIYAATGLHEQDVVLGLQRMKKKNEVHMKHFFPHFITK